jgi:hypothetical protein
VNVRAGLIEPWSHWRAVTMQCRSTSRPSLKTCATCGRAAGAAAVAAELTAAVRAVRLELFFMEVCVVLFML